MILKEKQLTRCFDVDFLLEKISRQTLEEKKKSYNH